MIWVFKMALVFWHNRWYASDFGKLSACMNYGGTLKLILNAQTKKTMQLPDIEYFLLQVKHKHNIYTFEYTNRKFP